jgi:hypothetical protein
MPHQVEQDLQRAASTEADLLTSCLITASRLVILRRRPFSVIVTGSFLSVIVFL